MSRPYGVADLMTKIRNGQQARLGEITHPTSRLSQNMAGVLLRMGVIDEYTVRARTLHISLKYTQNQPAIRQVVCLSRPGRRLYASADQLWELSRGHYAHHRGFLVLSTSKGILPDREARMLQLGGEVLCKVL